MGANEIQVLAAVLREKREALISRWREQVRKLPSAKHLDTPALDDHISALLEELSAQLERAPDSPIMEVSVKEAAPIHGIQRYEHDFDIVEVVGEYNILRGCIHALAEGNSINLRGRPLHVVNRVIDEAIAAAMQAFSARQALEAQRRREDHLAFLAHDLRTPISAISQAARAIELINPPPEDTRFAKMVNIVRRNGEHLQQLRPRYFAALHARGAPPYAGRRHLRARAPAGRRAEAHALLPLHRPGQHQTRENRRPDPHNPLLFAGGRNDFVAKHTRRLILAPTNFSRPEH